MSDRLTDQQLRDLRDCNPANPYIALMAEELLVARGVEKPCVICKSSRFDMAYVQSNAGPYHMMCWEAERKRAAQRMISDMYGGADD